MANIFVRRELKRNKNDFIEVLKHIDWAVWERNVDYIYYQFDNAERVEGILQYFPYQREPIDVVNDEEISAANIVVNQILNTQLDIPQPLILYFNYGDELDRFEYDNIHTPFEILGATYTYYLDRSGGDPNNIKNIVTDYPYFDGLVPSGDGYIVSMRS